MSAPTQNRQPAGVPVGGQFATTARVEPDIGLAPNGLSVPGDLSPVAQQIVDMVAPMGLRGVVTEDDSHHDGWGYVTVTNDAQDTLRIGMHVRTGDHGRQDVTAFTIRVESDADQPDHAGAESDMYGLITTGEAQSALRSAVLTSVIKEHAYEQFTEEHGLRIESIGVWPGRRSMWRDDDAESDWPIAAGARFTVDADEVTVTTHSDSDELTLDVVTLKQELTSQTRYLRELVAGDLNARLGIDTSTADGSAAAALRGTLTDLHQRALVSPLYQRLFG